jgi:hypothetical protein
MKDRFLQTKIATSSIQFNAKPIIVGTQIQQTLLVDFRFSISYVLLRCCSQRDTTAVSAFYLLMALRLIDYIF